MTPAHAPAESGSKQGLHQKSIALYRNRSYDAAMIEFNRTPKCCAAMPLAALIAAYSIYPPESRSAGIVSRHLEDVPRAEYSTEALSDRIALRLATTTVSGVPWAGTTPTSVTDRGETVTTSATTALTGVFFSGWPSPISEFRACDNRLLGVFEITIERNQAQRAVSHPCRPVTAG